MRNTILIVSLAVAALAAGGIVATPAASAQGTANAALSAPDVLIKKLSDDVLESIRRDPSLQSGDVNKLNALIDEKILPYVDFGKMTRLAVGRGWRDASAEQRQALTREFRSLLVRTYAGAVSVVKDHKVELRPFRAAPTDTDVTVRTQVVASRGDPIQLDYRLEKTDAGWKIYDVNVLGVWLVENYRNTFAGEISRGGVDGLIKSLVERNKALESKSS
jgi:phospholipid transport system substrate-binding protein